MSSSLDLSRPGLFAIITFFVCWAVQVLLLLSPFWSSWAPQILLLSVLALGGQGKTNMAMTLGFLWGLSLDVFGASLFGTQALLLCVAGM